MMVAVIGLGTRISIGLNPLGTPAGENDRTASVHVITISIAILDKHPPPHEMRGSLVNLIRKSSIHVAKIRLRQF